MSDTTKKDGIGRRVPPDYNADKLYDKRQPTTATKEKLKRGERMRKIEDRKAKKKLNDYLDWMEGFIE